MRFNSRQFNTIQSNLTLLIFFTVRQLISTQLNSIQLYSVQLNLKDTFVARPAVETATTLDVIAFNVGPCGIRKD